MQTFISRRALDFDYISVDYTATDITESSKWVLGESVFTSFLVKNASVVALEDHFCRLNRSLESIYFVKLSQVLKSKIKAKLIDISGQTKVRIEFFRESIDFWPKDCDDLICMITLKPLDFSKTTSLSDKAFTKKINSLTKIKNSNYMFESVSRNQLQADFLWVDENNFILEASSSSLAVVMNSQLYFLKNKDILESITRSTVMKKLKELSYPFIENDIGFDQIKKFEEVILFNSVRGVVAVDKVGERELSRYKEADSHTSKVASIYSQLFEDIK